MEVGLEIEGATGGAAGIGGRGARLGAAGLLEDRGIGGLGAAMGVTAAGGIGGVATTGLGGKAGMAGGLGAFSNFGGDGKGGGAVFVGLSSVFLTSSAGSDGAEGLALLLPWDMVMSCCKLIKAATALPSLVITKTFSKSVDAASESIISENLSLASATGKN